MHDYNSNEQGTTASNSDKPQMPDRLRKFPLWGNFPIFYTVKVDKEGNPNFKDPDVPKREKCMTDRLCGVCGEPLGDDIVCIERESDGERKTEESLRFVEAAMHEQCALYASQVCPFLKRPGATVADESQREIEEGHHLQEMNVVRERPAKMGLFYLTGYGEPFRYRNDKFLSIRGTGLKNVVWF